MVRVVNQLFESQRTGAVLRQALCPILGGHELDAIRPDWNLDLKKGILKNGNTYREPKPTGLHSHFKNLRVEAR